MTVPLPIQERISVFLLRGGTHHRIQSFTPLAGGCINPGGRLQTEAGDFFLKWNDAKKYPGMFAAEARGLKVLAGTRAIRVPVVLEQGEASGFQFLLLEYIKENSLTGRFWENLGVQLAALHRQTAENFGLDHDNYMGSLSQRNKQNRKWLDFFIGERLLPQLDLTGSGALRSRFDKLIQKLPVLMTDEIPALLHGDLWSGNLIRDERGEPCLIDPAVYYGHREAEMAFTQLFGGFDDRFYESYHAAFPLQPGFDERAGLFNLYPLLVHTNLFGGGYRQQVEEILRHYGC